MKISNADSRDGDFHMPGEFERHNGTLLIWPFREGSWPHKAKEARITFARIILEIAKREMVYLIVKPGLLDNAKEVLKDAYLEDILVNPVSNRLGITDITGRNSVTSMEDDNFRLFGGVKNSSSRYNNIIDKVIYRNIEFISIDSDDSWARDVGPTCVIDDNGNVRGIDWKFNAWGGDFDGLYMDYENDDRLASAFCDSINMDYYDAHHFVLEGGSIHVDGEGTALVTESCLLSRGRNPKMSREEIEEELKRYLNVTKVIWLPYGIYNDETNEHVDNVCAFVKPGTVILAWTDDENDPQYAMSMADYKLLSDVTDAKGRKLEIIKLPIPAKPVCITEEDLDGYVFEEGEDTRELGERLAASYVNFYICNDAVLLPQFGDVNDSTACVILLKAFPDRTIIPIQARSLIVGGGNIHCITQQIPC